MIGNRDLFGNLNSPFVHKLASGLRAKDVMTYDVMSLTSDQKVKQAKEIMRLKKISGLPIVNKNKQVIGIISIDDIIHWLENQQLEANIGQFMTRDVVCVQEDHSIMEIMKKFKRYRYGRFPVVNQEHQLLGIITPGDVMVKFLQIFEEYVTLRPDERVMKKVKGFEVDLEIDVNHLSELNVEIDGGDLSRAGEASSLLKSTLSKLNHYSSTFMRKVAIVSYEAEVNVVIHAYKGVMKAMITPQFVKITFEDEGPGIADLDLALQPGWSTASEQVRELGFGAGMGLCNMKRWADELMIESTSGEGTTITAIIYNH